MPLVSVIIPYYKKIDYIKQSINSVLNQTFKDFEIIIVYDDSMMSDFNTLNQMYKNNPKIKIIRNSSNFGAGISRNVGIENSNGEIIAFLDADDFWFREKLEKQINFMVKNKFDFTFCNYEKNISPKKKIKVESKKDKLDYFDLINSCDIGLSTVMLNKKIIKSNLFPSISTQEDLVAWLKITKEKIYAYKLNEYLVIWNKVNNSLSSNFVQKIFDAYKVYYIYENFNFFKSIFYLIKLGLYSIKRKF